MLIVEGRDAVRAAIHDWLHVSYRQLEILEAGNAAEALRALEVSEFDVVIMDIGLPGIGSFEETRNIRARVPAAKLVLISVDDSNAQRVASIFAEADACIVKLPLNEGLRAMLDTTLERGGLPRVGMERST